MEHNTFKKSMKAHIYSEPAIGWFCTYTPEEILHAAGFNSYGIRQSSGREDDDVYLGRNLCSFVHSVFGGALNGDYNFLSGVIIAECCECMRRMYDGWQTNKESLSPQFSYQIDVPSVKTEASIEFFSTSVAKYKKAIETQTHKTITDEALIDSIRLFNKTRSLLTRLNELRKRNEPPVSGAQVYDILDLCMTTPKEVFNELFEPYLEYLEQTAPPAFSDFRNRIMIYGGMFNPAVIQYVEREETEGIVVCEDACNGLRYFEGQVDLDTYSDPVMALSARYLQRMPCPRIAGDYGERMPENALKLAQEFKVDGVIYYVTKRCENLYWEYPFVKERLAEHNFTIKRLEGDISGDIRKREIKSFIELIDF